jgi:cold shock CspA family protein
MELQNLPQESNCWWKTHSTELLIMERLQGIVSWFSSKGQSFGYILKDDGGQVFVHYKNILEEGQADKNFRKLEKGQRVEFEIAPGHFCAGTQAVKVRVIISGTTGLPI